MTTKKTIKEINRGLSNIGNTCYINSLTQCLLHSEKFIELFFKEDTIKLLCKNIIKKDENSEKEILEDDKLNITNLSTKLIKKTSYQLYRLIKKILDEDKMLELRLYVNSICNKNSNFIFGKQNDAQELYLYLINNLKEELKETVEVNFNKNIEKIYNGFDNISDILKDKINDLIKMINNDFSTVTIPFLIISKTIINCECNYINYELISNIILQLDIIGNDIYDCLDNYFKKEKCESNCSKCNQNELFKQEYIWLPPQILVINLKRFNTEYIDGNFSSKKNYDLINYPKELDISKYVINNSENKYELYAVCNHFGSLDYGHYYSYICKNDIWYLYDDNSVTVHDVNEKTKYGYNDAYILFYKLINN